MAHLSNHVSFPHTLDNLPRQTSLEQIDNHIADLYHVISFGLRKALVCTNGHIAARSNDISLSFHLNMFTVTLVYDAT